MFLKDGNALATLLQEPIVEVEDSIAVIERKIDPRNIHSRKQGSTTLKYISGTLVTYLLNEAFGYRWSYEILYHEIVTSVPKPVKDWETKKIVGSEEQPPYALVLGKLTVPGFGVKEQYGSQQIIGGVAEQANAIKGAATDALKKCASLMGIGAELYGETKPIVTKPKASKAKAEAPKFDPKDVEELKGIKTSLGITENEQLNEYVIKWTGDEELTHKDITPANIASFCRWLKKEKNLE